ncbi:MAG: UbiD family decarboxylase [Chloroflexi bacterium]|nr:UbiD family decarboxylase [Chloroflexota bacterium]
MLDDLRQFIAALETRGELARIKTGVDWDEELGAVAEESIIREQPALLFENVKGYDHSHGQKVLVNTNVTSFRRVLLAAGLPEDLHPMAAIQATRQRVRHPLKPAPVSSGPCQEVIETGDRVNVLEFPVPKWHPADGGRYILTWGALITRDPETGQTNAGLYRGMVHDRNRVGLMIATGADAWKHARKYEAAGRKSMPAAIVIGPEPVTPMVACVSFPGGVSEYDIVGAIRGEPLPVVRCQTSDLEVPASSEIVLEGELLLDPAAFLPEGPFGEYPGYYSTLKPRPRPVFQVNCVTHRHDPIFQGYMEGMNSIFPRNKTWSFLEVIPIWNALEAHGVPGITGVYGGDAHPTSHHILFVSIDKMYYGHEREVAGALWSMPGAFQFAKYVVVVDSDVDITDISQVMAAIATRVRTPEDIVVFPGWKGGHLDPSVSPEAREATGGTGRWDRVLIDATWPSEWKPRPEWGGLAHPPACQSSPEMRRLVRQKWKEYGLPG